MLRPFLWEFPKLESRWEAVGHLEESTASSDEKRVARKHGFCTLVFKKIADRILCVTGCM